MRLPLALALLTVSAGCAHDDGGYPSLAVRPAEARGFTEPAVTPPPPAVADPALDARLTAFGGRLAAIVRGFDADASRATRAADVTGARTVGSEAWIAAQGALAALDDWRAQAGGLASEIDDVARERVQTVGSAYPPLDALHTRADAEATRQGAVIATIAAKLPTP